MTGCSSVVTLLNSLKMRYKAFMACILNLISCWLQEDCNNPNPSGMEIVKCSDVCKKYKCIACNPKHPESTLTSCCKVEPAPDIFVIGWFSKTKFSSLLEIVEDLFSIRTIYCIHTTLSNTWSVFICVMGVFGYKAVENTRKLILLCQLKYSNDLVVSLLS